MKLPGLFLCIASFLYANVTIAGEAYYKHGVGDYIGLACEKTLSKTATFCVTDSSSCMCINQPNMGSMLYCGYDQSDSTSVKEKFNEWYLEQCPDLTESDLESSYENATNYLVSTSDITDFDSSTAIYVPIEYNTTLYEYSYISYKLRYHNQDAAVGMGGGLVAYWGLVVLIGIVNNMFEKFFPRQYLSVSRNFSNNRLVKLYRQHVILPATFKQRHTEQNFTRGYIPTRIQSIIIFGFAVLVIVFSATRYHAYEHNVIWTTTAIQLSRYIAVRTGIMTLFLLPLMYLFAGRNNFLIWLTGWKQSTFYTYHKWICRIVVLLAVTHAISFLCNTIWMGKYATRVVTYWYRWGMLALILMSFMITYSIGFIRHYSYELFLNVHILCALFIIVGVWRHTKKYDNLQYLYATIAVWGFDRVVRIIRLITFGVRPATVELVSDEILHLTVSKPSFWKIHSGAFGYVHFMESTCFWQSHPFSIVDNGSEINAFIKIKNGVTKTIYKRLLEKPDKRHTVKISIEGPYGDHKDLSVYDNVIMVSSNNGIPGPFSYARELSQKQNVSGKKTFVKFYWIIRNWDALDWFADEIKELAKLDNVMPVVYVTNYSGEKIGTKFMNSISDTSSADSSFSEKDSVKESTSSPIETIEKYLSNIEFRSGRPNLEELIKGDLSASPNQNVAVLSCAHNVISDDVRRIVASEVSNFNGRLDLLEELQTW